MKNRDMKNYDIEMWKYSRDLKVISPDSKMAFTHRHSASATLESVEIRTNEWGLRGGHLDGGSSNERRILFLGSSITLGWGVPEEQTVTAQLQKMLSANGETVSVLNGGVGNYNTERYVERFFTELTGLNPSDIVVQYFLRDAEELEPATGNILMRNSELAATLWIAASRLFGNLGSRSLTEHYRMIYREESPGFVQMRESLKRLAEYAKSHGIGIYLAMTPDVHNLRHYDFEFVHRLMRSVADEFGYAYIDLLPAFGALSPEQVWAMPGDPHPNALGHRLMAEALFPRLAKVR